ncbi:LysR family transcriptional regulator [Neptunicoccus cionae]|uniref:LysR family transcriptional regulator n=1 Tax=Neptunicoccus cionae TaxID=2035344 RepID=A0A916VTA0_9RHOB|nr:LysR family transcriptional regulator [Amylibacter cionae]GGA33835.1 LysR family transcriptional regulator [Amylibacter cionae]
MDIIHMKTLIAVVEESSFTAAAARLGIAKSVCSRRITDLETDLGAQLVNRSTRSVVPTDLGRDYYHNCLDILARIDAANEAAKCSSATVSGRLRLSLPIAYTEAVLAPKLQEFACTYQDVELVLQLSDKRVDLISDGFDAAVRIGHLDDSGLFARKIGVTQLMCCAAPSYIERHGAPRDIDDLSNHECLRYNNLTSGSEWVAYKGGKEVRKRITGRFSSNSGAYNKRLTIAGLGISVQPDFLIGDAFETGALVPVLGDYQFPQGDINIVYPQKRNMPASLRTLIDFLTDK